MIEPTKNQTNDDVNLVILEGEIATDITEHPFGNEKYYSFILHTFHNHMNEFGELINSDPFEHKIFGALPWVIRELNGFRKGDRVRVEGKLYYHEFEEVLAERTHYAKLVSIAAHKIGNIDPNKIEALPRQSSEKSPMHFFKEKNVEK
ncbi:MAG: hypothetical protein AAFY41_01140 [Bacteroidota bacterium]